MRNSLRSRIAGAIVLALFISVVSSGCVMAPVVPPLAGVYTNVEAPLDLNCDGGKELGTKRGEATSFAVLGVVAVGDAGIRTAAENGGLTRVRHADYRFVNVLFGAYSRYTTIVYGD